MATVTNTPNTKNKEESADFGLSQNEFNPVENEGRSWGKILIITALIVGAISVAVYFAFFRKSGDEVASHDLQVHEQAPDSSAEGTDSRKDQKSSDITQTPDKQLKGTAADAKKGAEQANMGSVFKGELRSEQVNKGSHELIPSKNSQIKGEVVRIKELDGKYYIIAGTFVDIDLAIDYANSLARQGVNTFILEPIGRDFNSRVSIKQEDSHENAVELVKSLKEHYPKGLWVKKH